MTLSEMVIEMVRGVYEDIPANATITVSEEMDDDGYSCCHSSPYVSTTITYSFVPEGKKRAVRRYKYHRGSVWDLIQTVEYTTSHMP